MNGDHMQLLRVATSGDYPPFSMETVNGYEGFDIDLTQLIAAKLGIGVEFKGFSWVDFNSLIQSCRSDNPPVDMVASGVTVTPDRRDFGIFSRPYLQNKSMIIGTKLQSDLWHLRQAAIRIGVNQGGYLEGLARRRLDGYNIVTTVDNRKLATMIGSTVDCILTDALEATSVLKRADLEIWEELESQDMALFIPKCKLQLVAEVDAILQRSLIDGTLAICAKRHGVPANMLAKI